MKFKQSILNKQVNSTFINTNKRILSDDDEFEEKPKLSTITSYKSTRLFSQSLCVSRNNVTTSVTSNDNCS